MRTSLWRRNARGKFALVLERNQYLFLGCVIYVTGDPLFRCKLDKKADTTILHQYRYSRAKPNTVSSIFLLVIIFLRKFIWHHVHKRPEVGGTIEVQSTVGWSSHFGSSHALLHVHPCAYLYHTYALLRCKKASAMPKALIQTHTRIPPIKKNALESRVSSPISLSPMLMQRNAYSERK